MDTHSLQSYDPLSLSTTASTWIPSATLFTAWTSRGAPSTRRRHIIVTSDQRTSGSGGDYIKQRHSSQEGMDYDPFMDGARKSTRLLWASRGSGGGGAMPIRRQVDMEPSTFSRATSALRRGVTICLVRSGPTITSTLLAPRLGLRTRRLGLHSRSSGGRGGIRRRTTPRHAL